MSACVQGCWAGSVGLCAAHMDRTARLCRPMVDEIAGTTADELPGRRLAALLGPRLMELSGPRLTELPGPRLAELSRPRLTELPGPRLTEHGGWGILLKDSLCKSTVGDFTEGSLM